MPFKLREMFEYDWNRGSEIYQLGIDTGNATFQTVVPSWQEWDENHLPNLRFVAVFEEEIVGWVALSAFSKRAVYRGVAEISIYIDPAMHGKGLGSMLMNHIIQTSEAAGFWTLTSTIFPENSSSIALHKKSGFREIGYREKLSKIDGIWRDVLLFERRSG